MSPFENSDKSWTLTSYDSIVKVKKLTLKKHRLDKARCLHLKYDKSHKDIGRRKALFLLNLFSFFIIKHKSGMNSVS